MRRPIPGEFEAGTETAGKKGPGTEVRWREGEGPEGGGQRGRERRESRF